MKSALVGCVLHGIDLDRSIAQDLSGPFLCPSARHDITETSCSSLKGICSLLPAGDRLIHKPAAIDHSEPGMALQPAQILFDAEVPDELCLLRCQDPVIDLAVDENEIRDALLKIS